MSKLCPTRRELSMEAPCRCTRWKECRHCASLTMPDDLRARMRKDREDGRRLRCEGYVGGCLGRYLGSPYDKRWGLPSCKCINGTSIDLDFVPWVKDRQKKLEETAEEGGE